MSPLRTPPHVSESYSDSDIPVTTTINVGRPFKGPLSTYKVGEPSSIVSASVFSTRYELNQLCQDFGILGSHDIPELMKGSTSTGDRLTLLEQEQVKNREDIQRLKNQVHSTNIYATLAAMDKDRIKKNQDQDGKQIRELRHRLTSAEIRLEVSSVDRYRLECEFYSVQAQMYAIQQELYWRGFKENCPTKSIDVLATYGDADPPELQEPSDTQ
ncbi:hypothetical protein Tco_1066757 [Tanacetum coccineum]|uniref:Uncharacterized protein n=1 Tax=Tanacetum coccineum TaxID=301880 RepID=A0ABQ5HAY4_9ASTR